jgi:shikimate 5-dehydrogenase
MTRPRKNSERELYGLIGSVPDAANVQKEWNRRFAEQGMDATINLYPTTKANLPERLSEMFHFDRRGYIVGKDLSRVIIPLLDEVEPAARRRGVTWVENRGGVLVGRSGARTFLPHSNI